MALLIFLPLMASINVGSGSSEGKPIVMSKTVGTEMILITGIKVNECTSK